MDISYMKFNYSFQKGIKPFFMSFIIIMVLLGEDILTWSKGIKSYLKPMAAYAYCVCPFYPY